MLFTLRIPEPAGEGLWWPEGDAVIQKVVYNTDRSERMNYVKIK